MPERRPLVVINGAIQQLPAGDTLPGSGGSVGNVPLDTQNATYTFVIGDKGRGKLKTNTTAYTWTIPPNSSVAFAIGDMIQVTHDSTAGNVTIARGVGVTLMNGTTDNDYTLSAGQTRVLQKLGTNRWRVI